MKRKLLWWAPASRWRLVGLVGEADEIPNEISPRGVILAGRSATEPKWIAFDCPCGAERVMINASTSRRPRWKCRTRFWTGVTLSPSIDTHHDAKKCHYLIRQGRTVWAADSKTGPAR